jgi:hypothetical protein
MNEKLEWLWFTLTVLLIAALGVLWNALVPFSSPGG